MTTTLLGVVRLALGVVFGLAAAGKLRDFRAFRLGLSGYGLSGRAALVVALAVGAAEVGAAVVCFAPVADRAAGVPVAALGLMFTAVQTYLLSTGRRAACMCFGASGAESVSLRSWSVAALLLSGGLLLALTGGG